MKKLSKVLKEDNIITGYLYFYIHLVTEVVCFFVLSRLLGNSYVLWFIPLLYDALAFVPQSLFGYFSDKYPKINIGLIGIFILTIALVLFSIGFNLTISIVLLCIGNGLIHVNGAEVTLRTSKGKMAHPAIFVGGGSFGVIIGKLLGATRVSYIVIALISLTMIPFNLLAEEYRKEVEDTKNPCKNFNYHNKKMNVSFVILFSVFIVIIRAYMGYGIPTSWNKTVLESILLFSFMGVGKCLGGIMIDIIGIRKTAIISILASLPFLCFGDQIMIISLFGIMLFSMTMAVTLALLVSTLKKAPGLAFGLTTIGLFLGTVPIFFYRFTTVLANCILISILTIICFLMANKITKEDSK